MPTFTELLPKTKSQPHAGIKWTPGDSRTGGLLYIESPGRRACYTVKETPTKWDGREFRFTCLGGQSDATAEGYDVFVGRGFRRCNCKGFAYGKGKPCQHIHAVEAILDNGWMDWHEMPVSQPPTDAELCDMAERAGCV